MNFENPEFEMMEEYAARLEAKEQAIFGKGAYAELSFDGSHIIVWCNGETYKIPYTDTKYDVIKKMVESV